jgi:hypothetical protein
VKVAPGTGEKRKISFYEVVVTGRLLVIKDKNYPEVEDSLLHI